MSGRSHIIIALIALLFLLSNTGCNKHHVKRVHFEADYVSLYTGANGNLCVLKTNSLSVSEIWLNWPNPKHITVFNPNRNWLLPRYLATSHDEWIIPACGSVMVRPKIKGDGWRLLRNHWKTSITINCLNIADDSYGLLLDDNNLKTHSNGIYSIKDGSCTARRYNSIGIPVVGQCEAYYFNRNGDLMRIIAGDSHPSVFLPAKFWRTHAAPDWNHRLLERMGLSYCGFQVGGFLKSKVLIAQDLSKGHAHPWRYYDVDSRGKLSRVSQTTSNMFLSGYIIWNGSPEVLWSVHDSISGIWLNRWDGKRLVSAEFLKNAESRHKGVSVTDWIIYDHDGVVIVRSLSDSNGLGTKSVIEAFRAKYRNGGIFIGSVHSIPGEVEHYRWACAISGETLWIVMKGGDVKSIKLQ